MGSEFTLAPLDGNFGMVARDIEVPDLSDAGLKTLLLAL